MASDKRPSRKRSGATPGATVRRLHNGPAGEPKAKKPKLITAGVRGVLRYALALIEHSWQPPSKYGCLCGETVDDGQTIRAAWSIESAIWCEGSHHLFDAWDAVHAVVGRYGEWEWEHGGEQAAALLRAIIDGEAAALDVFRATRIDWPEIDRIRHTEDRRPREPEEPFEFLPEVSDWPRRPERYELDMLFHTAPEPHDDEVEAAIRAARMESASLGVFTPSWDELPAFVREQRRDEMRIALRAAARVRAAQAHRLKRRPEGDDAALLDLFDPRVAGLMSVACEGVAS